MTTPDQPPPTDADREAEELTPQVNRHPATDDLVNRFAQALKIKLAKAEQKYGWVDDWSKTDWEDQCNAALCEHVEKGDPLDIAAFAAFAWHHGWLTASGQQPAPEGRVVAWEYWRTGPNGATRCYWASKKPTDANCFNIRPLYATLYAEPVKETPVSSHDDETCKDDASEVEHLAAMGAEFVEVDEVAALASVPARAEIRAETLEEAAKTADDYTPADPDTAKFITEPGLIGKAIRAAAKEVG